MGKTNFERTIYTNGENAIVRLPAAVWVAFFEAAQYLDLDSTQECFIRFLLAGGRLTWQTRWDNIVELLERSAFVMSLQRWELELAETVSE